MRQEKRDFSVLVQQLTVPELEQLRVDETDSGRLRLVELELERHKMVEAEEARSSFPPQNGNHESDSVPDTLADDRSLELDRQMAELGATRASLSLSASEGDKRATRRLEEVEKEIAALEVARERAVLAEEESLRRAVEDKRRKNEQDRNERKTRLSELAHQRLGIAEDIQSHVEVVAAHVSTLLEIGGEMENIALTLGSQGHYLRPRDNVVSYLNSSLAAFLPYDFPFPHSSRRGKLVEMEGSLLSDFLSTRQPRKSGSKSVGQEEI